MLNFSQLKIILRGLSRRNSVSIFCTAAAFLLFAAISAAIAHSLLAERRQADIERVLEAEAGELQSSLRSLETLLGNTATVLESLNADDLIDKEKLRTLIGNTSGEYHGNHKIVGFNDLYGVIRGEFISGAGWIRPDDYVYSVRPWWLKATHAKRGEIVVTRPYRDVRTGEMVLSYAQEIFAEDKESLGVLALDVSLEELTDSVRHLYRDHNGYGFLLDQEMRLITHPDEKFLEMRIADFSERHAEFAKKLATTAPNEFAGEIVSGHSGRRMTVNLHRLYNGWYIGLAVSKAHFGAIFLRYVCFLFLCGAVLAAALITALLIIRARERRRINARIRPRVQRERKNQSIILLQNAMISAFGDLVQHRDVATGEHINHTGEGLKILLDALIKVGAPEIITMDYDLLLLSARLHDIGKIAVADDVLLKPGKLTPEEFIKMKKHAETGGQFISQIIRKTKSDGNFLRYAKIFAETHHERWDGFGYPKGLRGEEIPVLGRLMAIVDVYDALVSARPYKPALSHSEAVQIIRDGSGSHFDPRLIEIFLQEEKAFARERNS